MTLMKHWKHQALSSLSSPADLGTENTDHDRALVHVHKHPGQCPSGSTNGHIRLRNTGALGAAESLPSLRFPGRIRRSEEHTSELQSLMPISYAVFFLKKKTKKKNKCIKIHQTRKK